MANFPGNKPYPLLVAETPMLDDGYITKMRMTSIPRGGTARDYNVKVRGSGRRIDKRPRRPYP